MNLFNNHIRLFGLATALFLLLSIVVAILPAINNQNNNAPLPGTEELTGAELAGKKVYIENGCVACHSQQVRNVAMDNGWGERPSVAADYANSNRMSWWMNSATLMGTERTGPDLTNIGNRLPSEDWHLVHLYNPRIVVEESIMPAYPWLFEIKTRADEGDRVVNIPPSTEGTGDVVVATEKALQLVAYLKSLKQVSLPTGFESTAFLYQKEKSPSAGAGPAIEQELDGAKLYAANCQACHQANGEGLPGAFPPLKGSKIVLDKNPETLIDIVMNGYDAREEFAKMPAIGKQNKLSAAEIAAIINHERTQWGNDARRIPVSEVEDIISFLSKSESNPEMK